MMQKWSLLDENWCQNDQKMALWWSFWCGIGFPQNVGSDFWLKKSQFSEKYFSFIFRKPRGHGYSPRVLMLFWNLSFFGVRFSLKWMPDFCILDSWFSDFWFGKFGFSMPKLAKNDPFFINFGLGQVLILPFGSPKYGRRDSVAFPRCLLDKSHEAECAKSHCRSGLSVCCVQLAVPDCHFKVRHFSEVFFMGFTMIWVFAVQCLLMLPKSSTPNFWKIYWVSEKKVPTEIYLFFV